MIDHRKEFIKVFNSLSRSHSRHELFSDFLEMATTAIRKRTLPEGEAADAMERRYMDVVKRHSKEDVNKMPELLGLTHLALFNGGGDFLGQVAGELELLDSRNGQFFTPYDISLMMAEMILADAGQLITERGFITLQEPACGAGGMVLAAAQVIEKQGFDPMACLYVEAIDISPLPFKMAFLQLSVRGIPATVRRGNTLSLEMFENALTPAFFPFYSRHAEAFDTWRSESKPIVKAKETQPAPQAPKLIGIPATAKQLTLFD